MSCFGSWSPEPIYQIFITVKTGKGGIMKKTQTLFEDGNTEKLVKLECPLVSEKGM